MKTLRLCALLLSALTMVNARVEAQALTVDDAVFQKLVDMYVRNGIAELRLDPTSDEGRTKIFRLTEAVRDDLRDRELILAEAKRRGLPVESGTRERRARWMARFDGDKGYRAYLAEHRLTDAEFLHLIRQELAGELLREALTRDIQIQDSEVVAFYEAGRKDPSLSALFVGPATATAAHILVEARPGLHSDIEARRARAERLRQELIAGADFATLARQHSDDRGTRDRGGDLGTFTRDTHTDAFDAAVFALSPGEISPVVRTEYGFHIVRVTARSIQRMRTLDELRPLIRERLRAQASARHLAAWLQQQRSAAAPSTQREKQ